MTFTNKTIHSNLLGTDFDVLCWEMQKKGRTETVVAHEAFEDIIFNKTMPEGFSYEVTPLIDVAPYPVMQCIMTDATRRKILAIGEAHPNTLVNNISRNNPVIMAFNRAFDRAAIRYLDLEGKFYSSAEIPDDKAVGDSDEHTESDALDTDYGDYTTEDTLNFDSGQEETSLPIVEGATSDNKAKEASDTSPDSYGSVVINFGKYRGKNMTVAQIWESDENWASYTAKMNVDNAGKTTKFQVEALKKYGSHLHKL